MIRLWREEEGLKEFEERDLRRRCSDVAALKLQENEEDRRFRRNDLIDFFRGFVVVPVGFTLVCYLIIKLLIGW